MKRAVFASISRALGIVYDAQRNCWYPGYDWKVDGRGINLGDTVDGASCGQSGQLSGDRELVNGGAPPLRVERRPRLVSARP